MAAIGIASLIALVALTASAHAKVGSLFKPAVHSRGGAVASESRIASRVGIRILDEGGNAMDAGVAMTFAMGVTRPDLCGPGAGGFLVYRSAHHEAASLDFREQAPSTYSFTSGIFEGTPAYMFGTGHNTVGVPGMVGGMASALARYGTKSLSRAVAPAQRLARNGVPVSPQESFMMDQNRNRFLLYPESARTYLKSDGSAYAPGETIVLADLAKTLGQIRAGGPSAFYEGPAATAIAADMQTPAVYPGDQGTMSAADLAAYRPIWRRPISRSYRGFRVTAEPPPASGGVAVLEMLNILGGYDLRGMGQSSADEIHVLAEAQKLAWADRNQYLADPRFVKIPRKRLISKRYARSRRHEISMAQAKTYMPGAGPVVFIQQARRSAGPIMQSDASADRGAQTENLSAIDRQGNAVAITCSNEQLFGSAVVAPGTGFVLNNTLTDFDPPGLANEPAPGKRPRSSQSPTIVSRNGVNLLAVGGAGGPSIITGVLDAVVNEVDFRLGIARAIDAERWDARAFCDGSGLQLCLEDARIDPAVLDDLRNRGHDVQSRFGCLPTEGPPCEYSFLTHIQAVGTSRSSGDHVASADPRNHVGEPMGSGPPDQSANGALGQ